MTTRGRGPAPKDPSKRARRDKRDADIIVMPLERAPQPELPPCMPDGAEWPSITRDWWAMWGRSALTRDFTENDWSELLDTAVFHAKLWTGGGIQAAAELRLRAAKFGATPEDRARLRIQFATADVTEAKVPATKPETSARERRTLHAL